MAFYAYWTKGGAAVVTVAELMVHSATDGSRTNHLNESILNSVARPLILNSCTISADCGRVNQRAMLLRSLSFSVSKQGKCGRTLPKQPGPAFAVPSCFACCFAILLFSLKSEKY